MKLSEIGNPSRYQGGEPPEQTEFPPDRKMLCPECDQLTLWRALEVGGYSDEFTNAWVEWYCTACSETAKLTYEESFYPDDDPREER